MSETSTIVRPGIKAECHTELSWLWHVVLVDDDEHTYEYVMTLAQELFGHTFEGAFEIAKTVDTQGRAVLKTTHRELAELKREQAIGFGRDLMVAGSTGPMRVVLEPAEG